ncbi:MAG: putative inorganic carbon transporter subunit DabA, partial [Bacteroidota bacterium]
PGLPSQMIEVHDPVRILFIVEQFPDRLLKLLQRFPLTYEWYKNEWVHIAAMHPETKEFYYFKDEKMNQYHTNNFELKEIQNVHKLFEEAPEMINNHILNATFENLPIYQIENTL